MKKITFLIFSFSHFLIFSAAAQETFINDRLTATDDLNGTSRYVGMGGALGALGADLSVIDDNPAGIGLYRKSDVGATFGVVVPNKANGWNTADSRTYGERLVRPSFDQMGFVWSMKMDNKVLKFMNFSVNFQKKANYNMGFYADNANLGGLSMMDQVVELANANYDTDYNHTGLAVDNNYLQQDAANLPYYNTFRGQHSQYTTHQRGSLQSYDINLAFNLKDRFYTGVTFGFANSNFAQWSEYGEWNVDPNATDGAGNPLQGDFALYNDREIQGAGLNAKFGFIVRPIEDDPFRIGLTIETPTRYRMKSSSLFDLTDLTPQNYGARTNQVESYIETVVRTPWRARLSLGSTFDKILAWGVEYEYANTSKTHMGYPTWDDPYYNTYDNSPDRAMNLQTEKMLRGQHTVKAGLEVKPDKAFAIRVGYNFVSSRYRKNTTFDQYMLDSPAMDYMTSSDWLTLGATNIATFGLGYTYKKFYVDLAYKFRTQSAKFHAFDTSFTTRSDFAAELAADALRPTPAITSTTLQPVNIDLNRHQVQLSIGLKL